MDAALYFASLGWPVFRCDKQKKPMHRNGFKDSTTDIEKVTDWWIDTPDASIGIATGPGLGSRLFVVDVDSYKTGGTPEWDEMVRANGLPPTFTVRTGNGGTQYYFTTGEPLRNNGGILPNIDMRGDGGYVIAPPSITVFGHYEILSETMPAPLPEWVAALARKTPPSLTGVARVTELDYDPEELTTAQREYLRSSAERAVAACIGELRECRAKATPDPRDYKGEYWDETTYKVACSLIELANTPWADLTEADAWEILASEAPRDAGFTDADVLAKWDSARRTIGNKIRSLPKMPYVLTVSEVGGQVVDPSAFFIPKQGLDSTMLATAVLEMGPLAVDFTDSRTVWRYNAGVWVPARHEISDRCTILLGNRFRPNHVSTITPVVTRMLVSSGAIITCEPVSDYLNLRNGMLHWATGRLYPHDPTFLSTVQLPVEWDPDAVCPNFDQFAKEVMAEDAISYLWEILGYLVYSGNPFQLAFLLHGRGINGKGTLIRVLRSLLGYQNVSEVTLTDLSDARFEVASLFGKIANLAGDIDATYMRNTAKFKAITGQDTIRAERKFEHGFSFQCWAVPLFSANEFWKSADTTTGYKRRWQLLPFPNSFDGKDDPGLGDRLAAEVPGILVKAVTALQVLMARGRFDTPKSALDEKQKFELAADQVSEWLTDDPAVVHADPKDMTVRYPVADAYRRYRQWADESGNGALPSSKWWQRMLSLGYTEKKSGVRLVMGLSVDVRLVLVRPNPVAYLN